MSARFWYRVDNEAPTAMRSCFGYISGMTGSITVPISTDMLKRVPWKYCTRQGNSPWVQQRLMGRCRSEWIMFMITLNHCRRNDSPGLERMVLRCARVMIKTDDLPASVRTHSHETVTRYTVYPPQPPLPALATCELEYS